MSQPLWIKICGLRERRSIESAVLAGADAVGFVLSASPRQVTIDQALQLMRDLPPTVQRVAVLRQPTRALAQAVVETLAPDLIQSDAADQALLVGWPAERFLPVLRDDPHGGDPLARLDPNRRTRHLLFEAAESGRGMQPDWERAALLAARTPLILAGGLRADNVAQALHRVRPAGVDVSSGVESAPGVKDQQKITEFIRAARVATRISTTKGD